MSYAAVAAHNAPPPSEQPHPDPALFSTEPPSADNIADDAAKLNIVSSDFKSHPATITSETHLPSDSSFAPRSSKAPAAKDKARKYAREAEEEGFYLWNVTKQYVFQPAVAGGLLGLVNVGLIGAVGYQFYTTPHLRRDTKVISTTAAATVALFGAEGYLAEWYSNTPQGQREKAKAKEEGAIIYQFAKEVVLRPGVFGGLLGLVNAGVLGTVGYFAYTNWDAPRWDRRTVSAVSVSLLTLWAGEGYLTEQYRKKVL